MSDDTPRVPSAEEAMAAAISQYVLERHRAEAEAVARHIRTELSPPVREVTVAGGPYEPSEDFIQVAVMPCTCRLVTVPAKFSRDDRNTLIMLACGLPGCSNLSNALQEADRRDVPVEIEELPL